MSLGIVVLSNKWGRTGWLGGQLLHTYKSGMITAEQALKPKVNGSIRYKYLPYTCNLHLLPQSDISDIHLHNCIACHYVKIESSYLPMSVVRYLVFIMPDAVNPFFYVFWRDNCEAFFKGECLGETIIAWLCCMFTLGESPWVRDVLYSFYNFSTILKLLEIKRF